MKTIKNVKGNTITIFAETFENEAYEQIKNLSNFEAYQDEKIVMMPDAHSGKGCTVGTTMTISNKITPNLVGVDISCGVLVAKLKTKELDLAKLDDVIRNKVPFGFNTHEKSIVKFDFSNLRCSKYVDLGRALLSIGSLGGGNHFIESNKDSDDNLYIVIHSGSRKLGADVCKYYQDLAFQKVNEMSKQKAELVKRLKKEKREKDIEEELKKLQKPITNKELAYLEGEDFDNYVNDMKIVQEYASLNRKTMMNIILKEMNLQPVEAFETVHNYIDFNRNILRKGAVSANEGEKLIIPINMQYGSLICIGKGNPDWNYSAPHGAGRLMSRSKAKQLLNMKDFKKSMKGIYTTSVNEHTLDEAPMAYKNADEIINAIQDTVEIIDIIKPIYNFKASENV